MANKREKRFKVKGAKYDHKRSDGIDRWRARETKVKALTEPIALIKRSVEYDQGR